VALSVIFIVLVTTLSWVVSTISPSFFAMLVADAIALGVVYFLYTLWHKRAIGLDCNHCGKYIASNTPWVCGFCKAPNTNANEHPFVGKCERCGNEPKAYKCHHQDCGKLIFLTPDMLEMNYAYCLNSPAEIPKPDEKTKTLERHATERRDKEHQLAMAELDAKSKELKERMDGPKIKTSYEQKKEKMTDYYNSVMGIREDIRKLREEAAEKYKNDSDSLKDANDALDEIEKRLT
jgi:hypothetical protein